MKDNWQQAFDLDADGNVKMRVQTSTGGGTAIIKDLDFGLSKVIDPATNSFRILIN